MKREEDIFYKEGTMPYDCCNECGEVYFEHTAHNACLNLECKCHVTRLDGGCPIKEPICVVEWK